MLILLIRQSISSRLSVSRMFFTVVPLFMVVEVPLSFRSLVSFIVSPSLRMFPLASFASIALFLIKIMVNGLVAKVNL